MRATRPDVCSRVLGHCCYCGVLRSPCCFVLSCSGWLTLLVLCYVVRILVLVWLLRMRCFELTCWPVLVGCIAVVGWLGVAWLFFLGCKFLPRRHRLRGRLVNFLRSYCWGWVVVCRLICFWVGGWRFLCFNWFLLWFVGLRRFCFWLLSWISFRWCLAIVRWTWAAYRFLPRGLCLSIWVSPVLLRRRNGVILIFYFPVSVIRYSSIYGEYQSNMRLWCLKLSNCWEREKKLFGKECGWWRGEKVENKRW